VSIPKLENCPKCKGNLILEKDDYGLYQQCLQCGYLHELKTFPIIESEETEDEEEPIVTHYVSAKGSRAIFRDTARLVEGYHRMDALHKRHQENRQ
jgi:DNA-directed RNA polymerase subunit M/transcription elongation factor TFIIS